MEFTFTVTIDRSPEDVFGFFRDVDRHAGRRGTVVPLYERITDGPVGTGARYREVIRLLPLFGVEREMLSELTGYEPGRRLAYTFSGLGMEGELVYRFEAIAAGTRVVQRQSLRPRGALRLLGPAIGMAFSLMAKRRLRGIKGLFES